MSLRRSRTAPSENTSGNAKSPPSTSLFVNGEGKSSEGSVVVVVEGRVVGGGVVVAVVVVVGLVVGVDAGGDGVVGGVLDGSVDASSFTVVLLEVVIACVVDVTDAVVSAEGDDAAEACVEVGETVLMGLTKPSIRISLSVVAPSSVS